MSKNKSMKKLLEYIYGEGCFFSRARIAERIEAIGGIKTFKTFINEKVYKGKPISYQLTVHHLKHRSEGGDTTEKNCANIMEIAHQYIHSLPREKEEVINNMIRDFKINCLSICGNELTDAKSIEFQLNKDFLTIPVYNNDKNIIKKRRDKKKILYKKKKNLSRAEERAALNKIMKEEDEGLDLF